VKARRVKGLDPAAPLADNAARIIRVRLDELCSFMPRATDPEEVVALHDMRIAAKRLRYVLEVTGPVFGDYAERATRMTKDLQDALVERAGAADDLDPRLLRHAPHRRDYAGLAALAVHLRARRQLLFQRFLELWNDYERKGFRARLEYAVTERTAEPPAAASIQAP
jgi:CHAD domain-containing protein